jgi:acetylornithine deacetylase/succinyl-diaminopimelate desuccinylase-like protein
VNEQIRSHVNEHIEDYADELIRLLNIKSVSMTHEGITECAEYACALLEKYGVEAGVYPTSGHPVVIGHAGISDPEAPAVLIYGHYDVMPEGPLELWESDPFHAVVRDGRIWGRGAGDNKGQFFCHILAQKLYREFIGELPVRITYLLDGEEEIASPHLPEAVERYRDLLKADLALWSDAGMHESGRPTVMLGLKGFLALKLTCRTIAKPIHSQYASSVPSASWRLISALATMKGAEGAVLVDGFYENVIEPGTAETDVVASIPVDPEAQKSAWGVDHFLVNRKTDDFTYNYAFEPTLNAGCILGGYPDGSKNVTVDEASCWIDCRMVPNQTADELTDKIRKHLEVRGYGDIKVEKLLGLPWTRTPLGCEFLPPVLDALRDVYGEEPVIYPMLGGSGPFYIYPEILGMPWILLPVANADQNEHGPNENLRLDYLANGICMGIALIEKLAQSGK